MTKLFYLNELLDLLGRKIAENCEMHKQLSEMSHGQKVKKLFHDFFEQDKKSRNSLIYFLLEQEKKHSPGIKIDYEYSQYMNELLEAHKIKYKKAKHELENDQDMVHFAIENEQETLSFFEEIKNYANNEDLEKIDELAKDIMYNKERRLEELKKFLHT